MLQICWGSDDTSSTAKQMLEQQLLQLLPVQKHVTVWKGCVLFGTGA